MISLQPISPHDLTPKDIEALVKASQRAYDHATAMSWVQKALKRDLLFFRIEGIEDGVLGLEQHYEAEGIELWVTVLCGKGALREATSIFQELKRIQKEIGAKTLATMAYGKGLERLYQRALGIAPKAFLFQETLE
jgi:hypothetical protein